MYIEWSTGCIDVSDIIILGLFAMVIAIIYITKKVGR